MGRKELSERELALDVALTASVLLKPEYYNDFSEAIKSKSQKNFETVCERAHITDPDIKRLIYTACVAAWNEKEPCLIWP